MTSCLSFLKKLQAKRPTPLPSAVFRFNGAVRRKLSNA